MCREEPNWYLRSRRLGTSYSYWRGLESPASCMEAAKVDNRRTSIASCDRVTLIRTTAFSVSCPAFLFAPCFFLRTLRRSIKSGTVCNWDRDTIIISKIVLLAFMVWPGVEMLSAGYCNSTVVKQFGK